jgi:hypothetical protein
MPKKRSAKRPTPSSLRSDAPLAPRVWFALFLGAAALLPVPYGALADWHMFMNGAWDRPDTLRVLWSAAASGILCACAMLVLVLAPSEPASESQVEDGPAPDPTTMRLAVVVIAALFGIGAALMLITAIPDALVSAYCNFGVGKASTAARSCRITYMHGPVLTLGAGGAAILVLAVWLLHVSTARLPR